MNLLINVTELSCFFAEKDLFENHKDEFKNGVEGMYEIKENGERGYVEKAQDIFNDLVDYYEEIIRSSQVALSDKSHSDADVCDVLFRDFPKEGEMILEYLDNL
tara:strand:+ start:3538 stop:3849 length:312 start_codon:yes stop_codon:yes gene_type:complete